MRDSKLNRQNAQFFTKVINDVRAVKHDANKYSFRDISNYGGSDFRADFDRHESRGD